jgi:CRISPR-associated protein Cas4
MEYDEDDFLPLSGIQHFAFCRRQWALIHIDQQWNENLRTAEGRLLHENAHDSYFTEKRGDVIISRGVPVFSRRLGTSGECDIVEFRRTREGITLAGRQGLYSVYPVEYKHGRPKDTDVDILQLVAQALCLKEMLECEIVSGGIFYAETKRRTQVDITQELTVKVAACFEEMHSYFSRGHLPKAKPTKSCNACSLKEICLPQITRLRSAKSYNEENLGTDGGYV